MSLGPLLPGVSPDHVSQLPAPGLGENERAYTQQRVLLSVVLNPLLWRVLVGRHLSVGLHQRVPHCFFFPNGKCLICFTISGQTHCD